MRKKLLLAAMVLALNAFSPLGEALAKPAYCTAALKACNAQCEDTFSAFNVLGRMGCYAGCEIGWALC